MKKLEQLYEGKAKKVYATDDPNVVLVDYKDDATAGDGAKKGTIRGKGVVNNKVTNSLMRMLEEKGIPTHYVEEISDRETYVKKVQIVPLEVIIRNVAAGSFTKRLGVPEGTVLKCPTLEFSYKNDDLHDPLINHYHALALGLATQEEIDIISNYAFKVNEILSQYLAQFNIRPIDSNLEFGRPADGTTALPVCKDDPVAPARVIADFAKKMKDKFEIKGGFMDGKVVPMETINALASIPALPVLQAQVLGTMLAPITGLAVVLKQIAEKQGAPAGEAAEAPAAE